MADPEAREALREAIHDWFMENNDGGCVHFDKGYGLFRLCDDPDQGVPIRALVDILPALASTPAPDSGAEERLRAALDVDRLYHSIVTVVGQGTDFTRQVARDIAREYAALPDSPEELTERIHEAIGSYYVDGNTGMAGRPGRRLAEHIAAALSGGSVDEEGAP